VPERINILFIIDYFHETGGTEKHLSQLILGLPSSEFHCSVVVFDLGSNPLLDELRRHDVRIVHLPVAREYVPNALVQAWRLSTLIRRNRYDVVQTFHQKADTYGALVAWLSGARHLVSSKRDTGQLRNVRHSFLNKRLKFLFDAFIVVADGVRSSVTSNERRSSVRVRTIYNGVDIQRFTVPTGEQRRDSRMRLGFSDGDFVVGMLARFRPEKNHDVLFEAASEALAAIPMLRILAVGAGRLFDHYRERCRDSPLRGRVSFVGEVSDVVPCLWAMDVGVLTPGANEGFSNAILEQMAAGLPMIVTAVGGNAEAVIDGVNGIVIPPGNPTMLAEAIIRIYSDTAGRESKGRLSRMRVEEKFSLETMCREHAQFYRALCAHS